MFNVVIMKKITIFIGCFTFLVAVHAEIRYVKPIASGNATGTSWANASSDLQTILNNARAGDEIWVAAGTYKPSAYPSGCTNCLTTRDYAFLVKDSIKVYGSFDGTETSIQQRNINWNPTFLSGDIGILNDVSDNTHHVVITLVRQNATVLDGFTIIRGNANGTGASYLALSQVYRNNGGGIHHTGGGTVQLNNVNLNFNNATEWGGGLYSDVNATVVGSQMHFTTNTAHLGGGLCAYRGTTTLTDVTFTNNKALNMGGGIYQESGFLNITNGVFSNNTAIEAGGVSSRINNQLKLYNSLFVNNTAQREGGALYFSSASSVIANSTFVHNKALGNTSSGAGFLCLSGSVRNCILWNNTTPNNPNPNQPEISCFASTRLKMAHCIIQGATGPFSIGGVLLENCSGENPLFVDIANPFGADGVARTADDGLRLSSGSPAIQMGTSTFAPRFDILGTLRHGNPDLGAYEVKNLSCQLRTTCYVDSSRSVAGIGDSWATAFKTLDQALTFAWNCPTIQTIYVARGTYTPTLHFYQADGTYYALTDDRQKTFHLPKKVKIYGGYPSGGGTRQLLEHPTILSGNIGDQDDALDNCYHVAFSNSDSTLLDGFTVREGYANERNPINIDTSQLLNYVGGGILTSGSQLQLHNMVFTKNYAIEGGGMAHFGSQVTISNTTFSKNQGTERGAAVLHVNTRAHFSNTKVENHYTFRGGGAIVCYNSETHFDKMSFQNNRTEQNGGAIAHFGGHLAITDAVFLKNYARQQGGAIYNMHTNALLQKISFDHDSADYGGALYNNRSQVTLRNATFSYNFGVYKGACMYNDSSHLNIAHTTFFRSFHTRPSTSWNGDASIYFTTHSGGIIQNSLIRDYCVFSNALVKEGTDKTLVVENCAFSSMNLNPIHPLLDITTLNCTETNPEFVNQLDPDGQDDLWHTEDDGLRLRATSPVINAGLWTNALVDIRGIQRINTPDLGAYEDGALACPLDSVLYVDAQVTSVGTGTSWATAYKNLDDAIDVAWYCPNVKTILVAEGTYKPNRLPYLSDATLVDNENAKRLKTFHLCNGVAMYGGYPSGGGNRDVEAHPTILTGISGGYRYEDYVHIVLSIKDSSTTRLDGFIVKDNLAVTGNLHTRAMVEGIDVLVDGAMTNLASNVTVANTTFRDNRNAWDGGGVVNLGGAPTFINVKFIRNQAILGGGMYSHSSRLTLINTSFIENRAANGGGMHNYACQLNIMNSVFAQNTASLGGGITNTNTGQSRITNTTFVGNNAHNSTNGGGGLFSDAGDRTELKNCIFWNNRANGSIHLKEIHSTEPIYINNSIIQNYDSVLTLNVRDRRNITTQDPLFVNLGRIAGLDTLYQTMDDGLRLQTGSPAINAGDSTVTTPTQDILGIRREGRFDIGAYEYSCLNVFEMTGGGTYCVGDTGVWIGLNGSEIGVTYRLKKDSIWVGNPKAGTGAALSFGLQTVSGLYTVIATTANCTTAMLGSKTVLVQPLPTVYPLMNRSLDCSDAVFALERSERHVKYQLKKDGLNDGIALEGTDSSLTWGSRTALGQYWVVATTVLGGCVQPMRDTIRLQSRSTTGIIYVNNTLTTGNNDGTNWANAYREVHAFQKALSKAPCQGNEIWVAAGIYKPSAYPEGCVGCRDARDYSFRLKTGLKIYGGFAGTETALSERNLLANPTIFSGDIGIQNDSTDNCYHVLSSVNGTEMPLNDLTVTDGNANGTGTIRIEQQPLFRHSGGGLYQINSQATLHNMVFTHHVAAQNGGALYNHQSHPSLSNTVLVGNRALFGDGGGMYNGNGSQPTLTNVTVTQNTAEGTLSLGGGCYYTDNAGGRIHNSIFWKNGTPNHGNDVDREEIYKESVQARLYVTNSLINGYYRNALHSIDYALNNINSQPFFLSESEPAGTDRRWRTADDGLQLDYCSPAIDAGDGVGAPLKDVLGNGLFNNRKDMGAYERQLPTCIPFRGAGTVQTLTQDSVSGYRWYYFFTNDGLVAALNPNGNQLGTVTVQIWDSSSAIYYNRNYFLGRSINVTSHLYPSHVLMPQSYTLRLYYYNSELETYNQAVNGNYTLADLNMAWRTGGTGALLGQYGGNRNGLIPKTALVKRAYGRNDNGFSLEFELNHFTIFVATAAQGNPVSVSAISSDFVRLYPSPFTSDLTVEGAKSIEIINTMGQVIFKQSHLEGATTFELSDYANGIYVVRGEAIDGSMFAKKILKR